MTLERFWPEFEQINACIKNEAETADVSVLLAVHQSVQLIKHDAGTNIETLASERELLDTFLSDNVPSGSLLIPITGPSGVGKSHVIRWLDAQLQRSDKSERLHIIRIPKSASLRKVVELILAPLTGDPKFDKPRADLTRAVAELDKRKAVVLFRAQIENSLFSLAEALRLQARENPSRAFEIRPLIGHAEKIPKLFGDAALKDHFDEFVLARVVARALQGRDNGVDGDETLSQFFAEDLILPNNIDLNNAAQEVKTYYQTQIAVQDTTRRQIAVDLLNEIVDVAIGNVFQLEQSTGGITLQDIILGVREILLKDDKDLVLLVEDFAALSGIQDVLLKVCVQEGTYGGEKIRATMRTAMAITDGYLASRDTILTRAQSVWVIGNRHQTDEEIKSSTVEMVGSYLNAARWGTVGLRKRFEMRSAGEAVSDWLPTWLDEDLDEDKNEALRAFGYSYLGHPLFPFNRFAIERLVQHWLIKEGRLVFNPRKIINKILREPLFMRTAFVSGNFPPHDFNGLRPNFYLASLVRQTNYPEETKRRLSSALSVWAGNAEDSVALGKVPTAIFSTFSLPSPLEFAGFTGPVPTGIVGNPPLGPGAKIGSGGGGDVGTTTGTGVVPGIGGTLSAASGNGGDNPVGMPIPSPDPKLQDPRVPEWSKKLEAWSSGTELSQVDANTLRKALARMLKGAINWPALRIPVQEIKHPWLSIAKARGNPVNGPIIKVCDRHEDEDGSLREGFLGALRFGFNGENWDYPEAGRDYVASATIIEKLVAQLVLHFSNEASAQSSHLARALLNQARILGLSTPVRGVGPEQLLRGLLSPIPAREIIPFEEGWDQIRAEASKFVNGRSIRSELQEMLLDRNASFQGTGNLALAVDTPRLIDVLGSTPPPTAQALDGLKDDAKRFVPTMNDVRIGRNLKVVITRLRSFREEIATFIDGSLDKNAFASDLREVIPLLQRTNCWPPNVSIKPAEFEARLTEFQNSRFVDLVDKASLIVDEAESEQVPKLLNALGSMDLGLIQRTMAFLKVASEIINFSEPKVAQQEAIRKQSDPTIVADEIANLLRQLIGERVTEGGGK